MGWCPAVAGEPISRSTQTSMLQLVRSNVNIGLYHFGKFDDIGSSALDRHQQAVAMAAIRSMRELIGGGVIELG